MSILAFLARYSQALFGVALLSSLLAGLTSSALVALLNQALGADANELRSLALPFVALGFLVPFLRWLSQTQFARLQQLALARLRVLVATHVAYAPYTKVEGEGASRFMAVLVEDISTVAELFTALPRLVMQGAIVLGGFAYLGWLSWQALVLALCLVLAGSLIHFWAVRRATAHLERAREAEDGLYGQLRALVSGAKELRLNAERRRHFVEHSLASAAAAVCSHRTRGLLTYVGAGSWGAFMFFVVIGGVIFVLSAALDVGQEVRSGYALIFVYVMFPLEDLLEAVPDLLRSRIALDRIFSACDGQIVLPLAPPVAVPFRFQGLELEGVSHRYQRDSEDGVFVLGPLSMQLRPGEVVFVVGGNGSGKTTLAKLLVGLYATESGLIRVNGQAIVESEREVYRQHFAAIFSDFFLFDALLGLESGDVDARAQALLGSLGLGDKVVLREGVFSTTTLSSGQQKRLALVVATLEDRPVYVFDEWAADQDPAFKDVFYARVLPELKARGKAVVVISHDDRYFHLADRCLKLDQGRLMSQPLSA